jgi:hypothetical protein
MASFFVEHVLATHSPDQEPKQVDALAVAGARQD